MQVIDGLPSIFSKRSSVWCLCWLEPRSDPKSVFVGSPLENYASMGHSANRGLLSAEIKSPWGLHHPLNMKIVQDCFHLFVLHSCYHHVDFKLLLGGKSLFYCNNIKRHSNNFGSLDNSCLQGNESSKPIFICWFTVNHLIDQYHEWSELVTCLNVPRLPKLASVAQCSQDRRGAFPALHLTPVQYGTAGLILIDNYFHQDRFLLRWIGIIFYMLTFLYKMGTIASSAVTGSHLWIIQFYKYRLS